MRNTGKTSYLEKQIKQAGGSLHGIMAKMLDCDLKVSKFELKLCYYVHF